MNSMQKYPAEALVKETSSLISLPEVCLQLRKVLGDPTHTIKDISKIIMYDPALTTRILRIVNSAYYGLVNPVKDITHALGILGEQDLNNLVIVTSIVKTINSLETKMDIERFWKSSIFCAVMSKNLAAHYKNTNAGELFLCGLLQNVGKLLIYYKEPDLLLAVDAEMKKSGQKDFEVEREFLGFDHAEVGGYMAKSWNFSDLLRENVSQHHHCPDENTEFGCQHIAYLAGFGCDLMDFSSSSTLDFDEIRTRQIDISPQFNLIEGEFMTLLEDSYEGYLQAYEAFCGGVN